MNQREKLLAVAVGGLVGLGVLFVGARKVGSWFDQRQKLIRKLEDDKQQAEMRIMAGGRAQSQLAEWEEQALPPDPDRARIAYNSWLIDWINRGKLEAPHVKQDPPRALDKGFVLHPFSISGNTDLRRLTGMLYEFYATPQLHRIRSLTLLPQEGKTIELHMTIDALSMQNAADREHVGGKLADALEGVTLEQYQHDIQERNLFGSPNNAPRLRVQRSYTAELGRPFRLSAEGSDSDEDDSLFFSAEIGSLPGARFDGSVVSWTPREKGDYSVVLEVEDDGIPVRRQRQEVRIAVVDPPPPAPPPRREERPRFDISRFTHVSFIGSDGEPQVWLHVRPTGEKLKLRIGDDFEIGNLSAVVRGIDVDKLTTDYEANGHWFRARWDHLLGEAEEIDPPAAVAEVGAAVEEPTMPVARQDDDSAPQPPLEDWDDSPSPAAAPLPPIEEATAEEPTAEETPVLESPTEVAPAAELDVNAE